MNSRNVNTIGDLNLHSSRSGNGDSNGLTKKEREREQKREGIDNIIEKEE
ncbi:hypothetical protein TIFTF001_040457 [Ficus carica]|uniref:Uncharacterized protein n=1 Tax=Ficus carica TaxID=3494 RepID=A0AA88CMH8_FICCA|nr:hypothetical protein TIFTF001_040457 [Ficus carica]